MSLVKDHEIAQLVNSLTSTAKTYGHTQQLREHISAAVIDFLEEHNLREKTCTTQTTTPTHLKNQAQETPPTAAEKALTEQTAQTKRDEGIYEGPGVPEVKAYLVKSSNTQAVFLDNAVAVDYAVRRKGEVHQLVDLRDCIDLQAHFLSFLRRLRS